MMSLLKLFCHVDDFCQWLVTRENAELLGVARKRGQAPRLSLSEVITILIHFHQSHYRDFKAYYTQHVCKHMRSEFPALVSYTRFVELIPSALPAMCLYLRVRFWPEDRSGIHRFDPVVRLPQQAHRPPAGLCRVWPGGARAAWDGSMASSST